MSRRLLSELLDLIMPTEQVIKWPTPQNIRQHRMTDQQFLLLQPMTLSPLMSLPFMSRQIPTPLLLEPSCPMEVELPLEQQRKPLEVELLSRRLLSKPFDLTMPPVMELVRPVLR